MVGERVDKVDKTGEQEGDPDKNKKIALLKPAGVPCQGKDAPGDDDGEDLCKDVEEQITLQARGRSSCDDN